MKFVDCLKRALWYIIKGVPVQNVSATIVTLPKNELLKGSTALITGGTSGIGYSIAKAFLNAGACCIITGRKEDKLQLACKELSKYVEGGVKFVV